LNVKIQTEIDERYNPVNWPAGFYKMADDTQTTTQINPKSHINSIIDGGQRVRIREFEFFPRIIRGLVDTGMITNEENWITVMENEEQVAQFSGKHFFRRYRGVQNNHVLKKKLHFDIF